MGYLTTFTIYNDGVHMLNPHDKDNDNNIKRLASIIFDAHLGVSSEASRYDRSIGNFANMVHIQQPRHADDHTLYVHMGNCVTEMNVYSQRTKDLFNRNPEFANKIISFLKLSLRELQKLQKDMEEK